jgi:hypothetical protein
VGLPECSCHAESETPSSVAASGGGEDLRRRLAAKTAITAAATATPATRYGAASPRALGAVAGAGDGDIAADATETLSEREALAPRESVTVTVAE